MRSRLLLETLYPRPRSVENLGGRQDRKAEQRDDEQQQGQHETLLRGPPAYHNLFFRQEGVP